MHLPTASSLFAMIARLLCVGFVLFAFTIQPAGASDWSQWRGDLRDGVAHDCPRLIESLPEHGLKPLWMSTSIPSAGDGGWGSPIVWDGKLYLFVHMRTKLSVDALPKRQYPFLAEDKRGNMSPAEWAEYEVKRREEDRQLSHLFQYTEVVHCLDASTGAEIWKDTKPSVYTRFLHSGSPTIVDGRLYVLGAGRKARCLEA
ncbi:MAG TPA: hypothetical protein VHV77_04165, partial [Pirellulales bacterium]|nr:hypothetical protein [Pirellulales bacterium]